MTTSLLAGPSVAPQHRSVPPSVSSAGAEATELAASAGLHLDGWQSAALDDALGERADGTWAAFEVGVIVGRQNGKGSILEARALAGLELFDESLILWSAHETKTAFEAFRRMEALFTNVDEFRRRVRRVSRANGDEGIELVNGARLRFVARSKGSGRGFSGDLIVLDEAYALTAEQIEALLPTLSARPNPQVWYTSSPPLDGATGEQLYRLRRRAQGGDDALCWLDWGMQGVDLAQLDERDDAGRPLVDLDDRDQWRRANPALGIRISEEFVARERRTLSAEGFARERLGIWPRRVEAGSGIVDAALWGELAAPEVQRPEDVAFALVVNRERTYSAVAYCGRRDDGLLQVGLVDWRPGTAWVVQRLLDLRDRWSPVGVAVHARSESLLLEFEKAELTAPDDPEAPQRGDLAVPSAAQDASAYGLFVDGARARELRHADDGPVNVALSEARARPASGGATWDDKHSETAPIRAVCHALWLWQSWAHLVDEYDPLNNIW